MSRVIFGSVLALLVTAACHHDMQDQPRYEPYEASEFFPDGRASRSPVPGTVPRGQLALDALSAQSPPVTLAMLERGRERYDIYCSPCHDRAGTGQGVIVQRGFKVPPTFHQERLRTAGDHHYFEVISRGFGAMYGYAARIHPRDRWAIVAYVRALQFSQNAPVASLPLELKQKLEAMP